MITFTLNGRRVDVGDQPPTTTLLQWLRAVRLTGTTEGCAEGACITQPADLAISIVSVAWVEAQLEITYVVANLGAGTSGEYRVDLWHSRTQNFDGPPAIGARVSPGVFVNTVHGSSGWALACGRARLMADLLAGRAPALDAEPFSPQRWSHR